MGLYVSDGTEILKNFGNCSFNLHIVTSQKIQILNNTHCENLKSHAK